MSLQLLLFGDYANGSAGLNWRDLFLETVRVDLFFGFQHSFFQLTNFQSQSHFLLLIFRIFSLSLRPIMSFRFLIIFEYFLARLFIFSQFSLKNFLHTLSSLGTMFSFWGEYERVYKNNNKNSIRRPWKQFLLFSCPKKTKITAHEAFLSQLFQSRAYLHRQFINFS